MAQDITEYIKHTLEEAILDIKRARDGGAKIGAFILASCFIEYMAGFVCGGKTKPKDYKDCVRRYLPSYNPSRLYKHLRCKLVHNYSEGGSHWLLEGKPQLHGQRINGLTIINLENFIQDLEKALQELLGEIESDPSKKQKAINRYNSIGLFCVAGLVPKKK